MKKFQIIHLNTNSDTKEGQLADALRLYNVTCFSSGHHVLIIDKNPMGTRVSPKMKTKNLKQILTEPAVKKAMHQADAVMLHFDKRAFHALKHYFSKQYLFNKETASTMSFKSRTQRAKFTLHRDGTVSTSKDLLDIDLIISIVRICYGEKPLDITSAI